MITIDIKEMYNNINTNKLLKIIELNLNNEKFNGNIIMELCNYDLKNANLIMHNNKVYEQTKSIPMGSPSSSIYARICMDYYLTIKNKEFETIGIREIAKNFDDIFMIVPKNNWQKTIQEWQNEMDLETKITREDENGCIEFLDTCIIHENDNTITTKWNKKEYASYRVTHNLTALDEIAKKAIINNRFMRTINLTSQNTYMTAYKLT